MTRFRLIGGVLLMAVLIAGGCPLNSSGEDPTGNQDANSAAQVDDVTLAAELWFPPEMLDMFESAQSSGRGWHSDDDPGSTGAWSGDSTPALNGGSGDGGGTDNGDQPSDDDDPSAGPWRWDVAVDRVAWHLLRTTGFFSTCSSLADSRIELFPNRVGTYGDCPNLAYVCGYDFAAIVIDYRHGCSSNETAGCTFSGYLGAMVTLATRLYEFELLDLVLAGNEVLGVLDATVLQVDDGVEMTGVCDLAIGRETAVAGNLTLEIVENGALTFAAAELDFDDGTTFDQVILAGVAFDPVENTNFMPQGGSVTFEIRNDEPGPPWLTVVVTFTEVSPINRLVWVQLGDAEPFEYELRTYGW